MSKETFSKTIASNTDYNKLVAEIYIVDRFVALLNQDEGSSSLKIDFLRDFNTHDTSLSVNFDIFVAALAEAKRQLLG